MCSQCFDKASRLRNIERAKAGDKRKHLRVAYGITPERLAALTKAQRDMCAICGVRPPKSLQIDHCHKTGRIRGLLCFKCNVFIGHLEQKMAALPRYLGYLGVGCELEADEERLTAPPREPSRRARRKGRETRGRSVQSQP